MRCISPAWRISTYSSRFEPVMARNLTRSRSRFVGSSASSSTRRLNCIQDRSRPLKSFCFWFVRAFAFIQLPCWQVYSVCPHFGAQSRRLLTKGPSSATQMGRLGNGTAREFSIKPRVVCSRSLSLGPGTVTVLFEKCALLGRQDRGLLECSVPCVHGDQRAAFRRRILPLDVQVDRLPFPRSEPEVVVRAPESPLRAGNVDVRLERRILAGIPHLDTHNALGIVDVLARND